MGTNKQNPPRNKKARGGKYVQRCPRESEHLKVARLRPYFCGTAPAHEIVNKQDEIPPKKEKKNKHEPFLILFLGDQNGHPEDDPRAYVLAKVGAVIR